MPDRSIGASEPAMEDAVSAKLIDWLGHQDVRAYLDAADVPRPWFPALRDDVVADHHRTYWFSALAPVPLIPALLQKSEWDFHLGDGRPSTWTHYKQGQVSKVVYCPFGNEKGIEPLVIWRQFHGMRENFPELSQEFRLYQNLYPEPSRKRFIHIDSDGNESEAARYGTDFLEIRTDLLLRFCAVKQMALVVFVDSHRYTSKTLSDLGLAEARSQISNVNSVYSVSLAADEFALGGKTKTVGGLMGKKFCLPPPMPSDDGIGEENETYQEFVIGTDAHGRPLKHTCDPDKLANYFGKNPQAPHYLTPIFFRPEVLAKYYAEPQKYTVEDGYLRCGGLWGLQMDNDHTDYVAVFLGDLGRDLSEAERNYWLSFNIPPDGRKLSRTNFQRSFMAVPTDPERHDLVFKSDYIRFRGDFVKAAGWDLFLPLHQDDEHFFTQLRTLAKDNQSEFDSQLLALTKLLVDSLNENEIAKRIAMPPSPSDKGITKLEKFFSARGLVAYEPHVKFLRGLQNLRSTSAAHRKGNNYEKLIEDLQMEDVGQQRTFAALLDNSIKFIHYLRSNMSQLV